MTKKQSNLVSTVTVSGDSTIREQFEALRDLYKLASGLAYGLKQWQKLKIKFYILDNKEDDSE